MANQVTLTFAGDSKSLEKTFNNVGDGAKQMAKDFDKASGEAKSLDSAMGTVGGTIDSSESKFMGAADLLDGLSGAIGINVDAQLNMARSFGDMAGGLTNLGPLLSGIAAKTGITTAATWAWNAAQTALNFVLSANPIALVVIAIAALVAGFVIAYKNSETFRDVVHSAMNGVKTAVGWALDRFNDLWNFIKSLPGKVGGALGGMADIITAPYRTAFSAIKSLWNSTIGGFSIRVPSWVPVVGGKGFDFPRMHIGGVVPGNPGNPVPIIAMAGETVGRAGASNGGGGVTIIVQGSLIHERQLGDIVHSALLGKQSRSGNLGFEGA